MVEVEAGYLPPRPGVDPRTICFAPLLIASTRQRLLRARQRRFALAADFD